MKKQKSNLIQYSLFNAPDLQCEIPLESSFSVLEKEFETIAYEQNPIAKAVLDSIHDHRDSVCKEWRVCGYQEQCFTPQNEEDGICFKDSLTSKGKQQVEKTLMELCEECHSAHPGCPDCCSGCTDQCNAGQRCSWPGMEAGPDNPKDLTPPEQPQPVFSRDELKLLDVGYSLVRYTRDEKRIELATAAQISRGWCSLDLFPTYAAAERKLKELKENGCIEVNAHGLVIMTGWNQPGGLLKNGFEFYRCYGLRDYETNGPWCIKIGSKNWSNLAKYPDREALQLAWDELMKDSKALEG